MNLLISISGLFFHLLMLLNFSSIAENKLVTVSFGGDFSFLSVLLSLSLFYFFAYFWLTWSLSLSLSLSQTAILENLFWNVLKASGVRWMLSMRGCLLCDLEYTPVPDRDGTSQMTSRVCIYMCVCPTGGHHWCEWPLPMGVIHKKLSAAPCLCVHVHPLSIHIMYRIHNMFSLQICAHIQSKRPHDNWKQAKHVTKRSQAHGKWETIGAGTGSLLGPALTSAVGASTLDPVHLISPMMSKG